MTVLITGAGGFIGSHVAELFLRSGYEVRALARYNGRGDWGHLDELPKDLREGLEVRLGDITDPYFVRDLVGRCDIVIHLAALIGIPYSYVAPSSYMTTNVGGTLNVLEACRHAGTGRIVVTSTSEVYGSAVYTPIDEKHPLRGQSPYAASKIAADKLAESYYCSFALPIVTLRPFNTYGPRQSARAIVPTILSQALSSSGLVEIGNPAPRRDLTFTSDTARAFLLAATADNVAGETIHIGQGSAISIRELADLCLNTVGSKAKVESVARRYRPETSEVKLLLCNPTKAKDLLGWEPQVSLTEGVLLTAEYIRARQAYFRTWEYAI